MLGQSDGSGEDQDLASPVAGMSDLGLWRVMARQTSDGSSSSHHEMDYSSTLWSKSSRYNLQVSNFFLGFVVLPISNC